MSKVWNPGAKREMVGQFLAAWCVRHERAWSRAEVLFGAYETFCRHHHRKDLTFGEFTDEMENLGYTLEQRYGEGAFRGLSLTMMEDGLVGRNYGARPSDT